MTIAVARSRPPPSKALTCFVTIQSKSANSVVGARAKWVDRRRSLIHRGGVKKMEYMNQMEYIKNAEDLAHVFSVATGPSFFLGAVAALLSVVLNRLNSVLARLDELTITDEIVVAGSKRGKDLDRLYKRADTLGKSIYLALGGGVSTLALLALLFVGAFFRIEHLYGAGMLFGIATCLVAASLVIFATDVRLDLARYVPNRQNKAGT